MLFVRGTLAGLATVIVAALAIYGLAVGVPRILELMPSREGGIYFYSVGPFPMWPLGVVALLIFSGGLYWSFRRATRHSLESLEKDPLCTTILLVRDRTRSY
jgi:hypothetical protein